MGSVMVALSLAGIMLLIGMVLRAKVAFFKKHMIPSSVIAGFLGFAFMNAGANNLLPWQVEFGTFSSIVIYLFAIAFISMILTDAPNQESGSSTGKNILKGCLGMGNTWNILYVITPLIGAVFLMFFGGIFNMAPVYGMMLPFGFAQGPGQSVTFGTMLEEMGWDNAIAVGMLYSVFGFIVTFVIGIPLLRFGLKRGLGISSRNEDSGHEKPAKTCEEKDAQPAVQPAANIGDIDVLTFHISIVGLCLIIAMQFSNWWFLVPSTIGATMGGMLFMNGILAAVIVKFVIKKLKLGHLMNNSLQAKITAWSADYLVIISFMAIGIGLIIEWIIPILILCVITTVVSLIASRYFIPRIGRPNDFERTIAFYGVSVGTIPTALVLLRVVDPDLKTTTGIELGLMNIIMIVGSMPIVFAVMAYAAGDLSINQILAIFVGFALLVLILHKLFRVWNKPSFAFFGKPEAAAKIENG